MHPSETTSGPGRFLRAASHGTGGWSGRAASRMTRSRPERQAAGKSSGSRKETASNSEWEAGDSLQGISREAGGARARAGPGFETGAAAAGAGFPFCRSIHSRPRARTWGQMMPCSRAWRQVQKFSTSERRAPSLRRGERVPVAILSWPERTPSSQATERTLPACWSIPASFSAAQPPICARYGLVRSTRKRNPYTPAERVD